MTYTLCKRVIKNTIYTSQEQKDGMQMKLDVFLLNDRFDNQDQYSELTQMLSDKVIE